MKKLILIFVALIAIVSNVAAQENKEESFVEQHNRIEKQRQYKIDSLYKSGAFDNIDTLYVTPKEKCPKLDIFILTLSGNINGKDYEIELIYKGTFEDVIKYNYEKWGVDF